MTDNEQRLDCPTSVAAADASTEYFFRVSFRPVLDYAITATAYNSASDYLWENRLGV